ncbi:MAG: DEAD/DEAH box helicase, partial [Treponema sp.]|nr:DEAD/DEAH box helicase [Treponema sp.]
MENTFIELGVDIRFVRRLEERNITRPTDIQRRVIPVIAAGEDLFFRSATGTGKTFAYLLPLLRLLLDGDRPAAAEAPGGREAPARPPGPRLLILAPTYELCSQIKSEADFLLRAGAAPPGADGRAASGRGPAGLRVLLAIGSAGPGRQIDALRKDRPALVVGNPGRILLLAKTGRLTFRDLRFLVLDEGDRLVADEMRAETGELLALVSREVRRGAGRVAFAACSATLAEKSRQQLLPLLGGLRAAPGGAGEGGSGEGGAEAGVRVIETGEQEILRERIEHWAIFSEGRRKIQTLRSFLAAVKPRKALVFSGRGADAGKAAAALRHHHIAAGGLYGGMDRKARKEALDGFRSGKISALVSSDLAARGLDIPGVTHVIALDLGEDADSYLHRAGRTGRAGRRGVMVSIGDEEEMRRLARLEKKLGLVVRPKELYGGRLLDIQQETGP